MNADAIKALKRAIALVDDLIASIDVYTDDGQERLEQLATDRHDLKRGLADLEGNGEKTWSEIEMWSIFDKWCASQPTARVAAAKLGVTPQYLCDMRASRRRLTDAAIEAIGYRRRPRDRQVYVKLPEKSDA